MGCDQGAGVLHSFEGGPVGGSDIHDGLVDIPCFGHLFAGDERFGQAVEVLRVLWLRDTERFEGKHGGSGKVILQRDFTQGGVGLGAKRVKGEGLFEFG